MKHIKLCIYNADDEFCNDCIMVKWRGAGRGSIAPFCPLSKHKLNSPVGSEKVYRCEECKHAELVNEYSNHGYKTDLDYEFNKTK